MVYFHCYAFMPRPGHFFRRSKRRISCQYTPCDMKLSLSFLYVSTFIHSMVAVVLTDAVCRARACRKIHDDYISPQTATAKETLHFGGGGRNRGYRTQQGLFHWLSMCVTDSSYGVTVPPETGRHIYQPVVSTYRFTWEEQMVIGCPLSRNR